MYGTYLFLIYINILAAVSRRRNSSPLGTASPASFELLNLHDINEPLLPSYTQTYSVSQLFIIMASECVFIWTSWILANLYFKNLLFLKVNKTLGSIY